MPRPPSDLITDSKRDVVRVTTEETTNGGYRPLEIRTNLDTAEGRWSGMAAAGHRIELQDAELLERVACRLHDRGDDLVARQLEALSAFPSYERVPPDDLARSCRRNVARVVATLRDEGLPVAIEEDERASGQRRALQGVPPEDVVVAYRAVLGVLRDAFIEEATAQSVDLAVVLRGTRRLWELTDRYSSVLVSARHQVDLDTARRDERQRMGFLHHVLTGSAPAAELVRGGALYGMAPDGDYWVFRARAAPGDLAQLSRLLERSGPGTPVTGLVGPIDGDLAGIGVTRPQDPPGDAVVAVAGPVPLLRVSQAFADATRLLAVAARYRSRGVVDAASMSVRAAVAQDEELGELLHHRYVGALAAHSAIAGVLLETVRAWLSHERSVAATAAALSVHVNTLRYRLERFAVITGANLDDTDDLVEIWWALQYATIRRS